VYRAVKHLTFSSSGGAGMVAQQLSYLQQKVGVNSELITATDGDIKDQVFRKPTLVLRALWDFFVVRIPSKSAFFTLSRNTGSKHIASVFRSTNNVVHLHWSPGIISLSEINKLLLTSNFLVWTLHDMWPITGGCHFAQTCSLFQESCSNCPQARKPFHEMIRVSHNQKSYILKNSKIQIVCPSNWMYRQLEASGIIPPEILTDIHNPVDTLLFSPNKCDEVLKVSRFGENRFVVGCIAANIDDPRKNIKKVVSLLESISESFNIKNLHLVIIGRGATSSKVIPTMTTGFLSEKDIADLASQFDLYISLAEADNLPLSMIQAASSGLPIICSDVGGHNDIVKHGVNGFIVKTDEEFETSFMEIYRNTNKRTIMGEKSREFAISKFSLDAINRQYLDLYERISI
jgi:glycosyltransferase involved in cell wall biosynthesis